MYYFYVRMWALKRQTTKIESIQPIRTRFPYTSTNQHWVRFEAVVLYSVSAHHIQHIKTNDNNNNKTKLSKKRKRRQQRLRGKVKRRRRICRTEYSCVCVCVLSTHIFHIIIYIYTQNTNTCLYKCKSVLIAYFRTLTKQYLCEISAVWWRTATRPNRCTHILFYWNWKRKNRKKYK